MLLPIVREAAGKVGGIGKLAEILGIKRQAFYMWEKVPPGRCLAIEDATGIPCHQLRPDIFPDRGAA